jgi:hypothetical protein
LAESPNAANPFNNRAAGRYFVGRENEVLSFENALDALIQGEPSHMYIAGVNGFGKTSCLAKLAELAVPRGVLTIQVDLDQRMSGHEQARSMSETLIAAADEVLESRAGAPRLRKQWEQGKGSPFRQPGKDRLTTDALRHDLRLVRDALRDYAKGILICIDLGERIMPETLSALTSAVGPLPEYLIAMTVRLASDGGSPARAGRQRLDEIAADAGRNMSASRAFSTAVGLGPFTPAQARDCVLRRLDGRTISFEDAVIGAITRTAEWQPRRIVEYAHDVYDKAALERTGVATVAHFRRVFEETHPREVGEARSLRDQISPGRRATLRELSRHDRPMSPLDLARAIYPDLSADRLEVFEEAVRNLLDRVQETTPFCRESGGRYEVPDAVRRYALEICLEPE